METYLNATGRSAQRYVRDLVERGLIRRERVGGKASKTVLIDPGTVYELD
jgi:hypothetical protein